MHRTSRRQFLQTTASLPLLNWSSNSGDTYTAYVGFDGASDSAGGIHVFDIRGRSWRRIQTVVTPKPAFLLLDASRLLLFAANDINEHEALPRGAVESFRIDESSGRLTRASIAGLSLSATGPRHLIGAGDSLIVAAHEGGLYNLLKCDAAGTIHQPKHALKEVGCGLRNKWQDSAHPHSMVVDDSGHIIASDFGCDRLTVFARASGRLRKVSSVATRPGDGPGPLTLLSGKGELHVLNLLSGSLSVYPYSSSTNSVGKEIDRWYVYGKSGPVISGSLLPDDQNSGVIALLARPEGSSLALWNARSQLLHKHFYPAGMHSLFRFPTTRSLVGLDSASGKIVIFDRSLACEQAARVEMPLSLAMRTA